MGGNTTQLVSVRNDLTHAAPRVTAAAWSGCLALASALHPTSTFVGYESGDGLTAAWDHGFETVGPLRVWVHDG